MTIIAPSILCANILRLEEEVLKVEKAGADWIHVDIMDGHFVPNLSMGPDVVKSIRSITKLPIDVHLMVTRPQDFIEPFIQAGANMVSLHIEASHHPQRILSGIRHLGSKAAIALNPATQLSSIEHLLLDVDMILLMSVNPGFGGQKYLPHMTKKIEKLSKLLNENNASNVLIEVDGGISPSNVGTIKKAGANVIVAGNAIFKSNNYANTIDELKN